MRNQPIYMDNHATTPLDKRVLEVMLPFLSESFGNPSSSTHAFGWQAEEAVSSSRCQVAKAIGARQNEIIFTSGATESNNMALKGVALSGKSSKKHIITSAIEHSSILDTCRFLESKGVEVTYLMPQKDGCISMDELKKNIKSETCLLSFMLVNNEIGSINCLKSISAVAQAFDILFHCDAAQGVGRIPLNVKALGIDLLSLSGHKIYAPKGVGALFVNKDKNISLEPLMHGGGQESGFRSGTLNVAGIVGLGKACALLKEEEDCDKISLLRDSLWERLSSCISDVVINGALKNRVAGNLNVAFLGIDAERLLLSLSNIVALSASSACSSSSSSASHVLKALGYSNERISSSVRFGIGRFNTEQDVAIVAESLIQEISRMRGQAPNLQKRLKIIKN